MKFGSETSKTLAILIVLSGLGLGGPSFAADDTSAAKVPSNMPPASAPPVAQEVPGAKTEVSSTTAGGAVISSKVFFKNLKNGQVVKSPVKVEMGVTGLKVKNAGEDPNDITSGHHHIIIDGSYVKAGEVVPPNDATHLHFGKGQTEAEVKLTPGHHTLTLQFADGAHRSYGEALSATVHIIVK